MKSILSPDKVWRRTVESRPLSLMHRAKSSKLRIPDRANKDHHRPQRAINENIAGTGPGIADDALAPTECLPQRPQMKKQNEFPKNSAHRFRRRRAGHKNKHLPMHSDATSSLPNSSDPLCRGILRALPRSERPALQPKPRSSVSIAQEITNRRIDLPRPLQVHPVRGAFDGRETSIAR